MAFTTPLPLRRVAPPQACSYSSRPSRIRRASIFLADRLYAAAKITQPSLPSLPNMSESSKTEEPKPAKRVVSEATRRKISDTLLGRPKSQLMKQKVSQKLKGRVPWNKGKKLSPETRARMSEARFGRSPWNKGRRLSMQHRVAISRASLAVQRNLSEETRRRMRMARRRPGDGLIAGSSVGKGDVGNYPLVESSAINDYVTLRRELRVWSDKFVERNGKRPSLADIRRSAPVPVVRKFERYITMRDQIRGLASDVYGSVDPKAIPVAPPGDVSSEPRNNNADRVLHMTKHGNPRLAGKGDEGVGYNEGKALMEGAKDDMWDMYDRPESNGGKEDNHTLIGAHELSSDTEHLSPSDYRKIGRYRLMETMDINRYVNLRKELQRWSAAFKEQYGRTPALSDARVSGKSLLYNRFCEYLQMRSSMSGLVKEVYGTEVDDVETLKKVNAEGKVILDTLRSGAQRDEISSAQ